MTDNITPPPVVDLENCTCLERSFFAIGVETGLQIRQIIAAEIANHKAAIDNLKMVIEVMGPLMTNPGTICTHNQTPTVEPTIEPILPPTEI